MKLQSHKYHERMEKPEVYAPLVILLLKRLHVLSDVATEDVLLQDLCIKLLGLRIVAREALFVVGDEDAAI